MRPARSVRLRRAFTLVELLVVVAVIAILAAIAVPNFLEAQVRSKVSRVKADLRSLGTAVQAYAVDHNAYPPNNGLNPADPLGLSFDTLRMLLPLSTPVAYIVDSHIEDPFGGGDPNEDEVLTYVRFHPEEGFVSALFPAAGVPQKTTDRLVGLGFSLSSLGPDRRTLYTQLRDAGLTQEQAIFASIEAFVSGEATYDPTNGTVSRGDISYTANGFPEGPR